MTPALINNSRQYKCPVGVCRPSLTTVGPGSNNKSLSLFCFLSASRIKQQNLVNQLSSASLLALSLSPSFPPFIPLLTLSAVLDGVKCHGLKLSALAQALRKFLAVVEHVFVWEDCSAEQSCFAPDLFFSSSPPPSPSLPHNKTLVL